MMYAMQSHSGSHPGSSPGATPSRRAAGQGGGGGAVAKGSSSAGSHAAPADRGQPDRRQRHFALVLVNQFSHLSFAGAIEPLRLANRMSGKPLYRWTLMSDAGAPVVCSNGTRISVDAALGEVGRDDVVLVCAGVDVRANATTSLRNWLRRVARLGTVIGGLCTGAHVLAQAGLLDGRRATIHWENRDGFEEEFPDITLAKSVFVIDGNRITAAGGTASLDLMLRLIADDHGKELANAVADQMIYASIRTEVDAQRLSIPTRIGVRHPRLAEVVAMMERQIEEPASPAELAAAVGMSTRQLERLFRRYLNRSPKRYYMELRLARARNLLMQTSMSVIEVALASGFTSPSHFSKCYRAQYGTTPYRELGSREGSAATGPSPDQALPDGETMD